MQIFHPTTSKSGIFLLELIIVILFFSIASTVCIDMFVKSYTMNTDSTNLNKCIQISENFAESFKNSSYSQENINSQTYYYDKDGFPSSENSYTYYAHISYTTSGTTRSAIIKLYTSDAFIYSLQVDKHIPERWVKDEK